MPERKCQGCTKQTEWGCTAKPHLVYDPETDALVCNEDGSPKITWSNPARVPEIFDDEETYACPRQTLKENPRQWSQLLMFFSMFKDGFLPQRGAVVDQSNKAIETLTVMNTVNQECDEELAERARRGSQGNSPYGRMV